MTENTYKFSYKPEAQKVVRFSVDSWQETRITRL